MVAIVVSTNMINRFGSFQHSVITVSGRILYIHTSFVVLCSIIYNGYL